MTHQLLDALRPHIMPTTIIAIAADKAQKPAHENYERLERFQIGKRRITLLKPSDGSSHRL